MILQELYNYYERKAADPESGIAPVGFEWKELPFLIVIDHEGRAIRLEDTREKVGKKLIGKKFLLPQSVGRPGTKGWMTTFLLWDHYGYLLGHPKSDGQKDRDMAEKQLGVFIESLKSLPEFVKQDEAVTAVLRFYEQDEYKKVMAFDNWPDCMNIPGCNLSFRIEGESELVLERKAVKAFQQSKAPNEEEICKGLCSITGKTEIIQRLHLATPIRGGQSGGKLVAFQKNSGFDSYGKEQGSNASIGKPAHDAYINALNSLIKNPNNQIGIGDTTTLFWSQKPCDLEQTFSTIFAEPPKDEPDKEVNAVKQIFESIFSGKRSLENQNRFFVLGLAPNAARISVRYWLTGTVQEFGEKICQHFNDLNIERTEYDDEYFSLNALLAHSAKETKERQKPHHINYKGRWYDVPPNLSAAVFKAVLEGTPYPVSLMHGCIRRIRAEQAKKFNNRLVQNVTRIRAAILKACINRYNRYYQVTEKEEIVMSLDKANLNPAYRLGRLFAVLERIQIESAKPRELNTTIRERYYGAASSTPMTVFPQLLKLKNHHIANLSAQDKRMFEAMIGEIMEGLDPEQMPKQLPLDQQARFAIGYYHQIRYRKPKAENQQPSNAEGENSND